MSAANRQIARAAGVVMAGFVLSNLTGLLRQVLVSSRFGTSAEIDAFNAAARLPETLFMLVAGGALASAFIPTFTSLLESKKTAHTEKANRDEAWLLASAILNLISLILLGLSALAFLFAPQIVAIVLAPSFPPEQQALTAQILRVLLLSPVIFGASGLLMAVLNTHQHFLLPALAPTLHWVGWIIGVIFLAPGHGVFGLAWGAVLGAGLHLVVQAPGLLKLRPRYQLTLGLHLASVREVARLMGPRLLGVAVVQLNFWINVVLASGMPEGSLTALILAFAVMTMPQVVIAQAIAIAALPTFSAQVARGELPAMRTSLAATLRGVLLLSIPAMIGLILLREPVISILFERGEFGPDSTALTAWALLWYTSGLVAHSVVEIVSRAFYALHDTRTPVVIGGLTMGLNVLLSLAFAALFRQWGWFPHGGLALANTLATTLEMVALLILMRRRLNGLEGRRIAAAAFTGAAAAAVMGAAIVFWLNLELSNTWWVALGGIGLGGVLYGLALWVMRVDEIGLIIGEFRRRFTR
jgi:putative peptidoglycan lipid II flippase